MHHAVRHYDICIAVLLNNTDRTGKFRILRIIGLNYDKENCNILEPKSIHNCKHSVLSFLLLKQHMSSVKEFLKVYNIIQLLLNSSRVPLFTSRILNLSQIHHT